MKSCVPSFELDRKWDSISGARDALILPLSPLISALPLPHVLSSYRVIVKDAHFDGAGHPAARAHLHGEGVPFRIQVVVNDTALGNDGLIRDNHYVGIWDESENRHTL